jgi:hypothetical protein
LTDSSSGQYFSSFGPPSSGYFGSSSGTDAGVQGEMIAWHTTNNFWLFFGSTLDQDSNDESYGISNIVIWVR